MKVGDLVKAKDPKTKYSWRRNMAEGVGIVIKARHRTKHTVHGCTVMWSVNRSIVDIPEDWLEVIND